MEYRDRWRRYFRRLRPLGSDEYSLGWSCASSGATRRDQGWTIRLCLRTSSRLRASPGTSRRARSWKEEQVSAAGAKIPRITGRLEGIDAPFGRQIVAGDEAEREIFQRNQNHGEAVSADHSAASCGRQDLGVGRSASRKRHHRARSEFGATGRSGEGNDIADVRDTGDKHQHTFEAEAKTGVWRGAVTPKIEIPFVISGIHFVPAHILLQHIEPLFALASADDFADSRHQQIDRGHCFSIVIQTHVKWFDLLRIIENRHRTLEMFLGQPPFVFRLEIQSVVDWELEFFSALP